jgi:hypothetical protein
VYVLIVGDVDVIPSGRSTRVVADPDGNDGDSDHVYEVLGNDRFPSLYVGRLSVNSAAELQTQLGKILSYERSPVGGDWPRRATLAANSQTDSGCYGVCADFPSKYAAAVNAITSYGGYASTPIFQTLHAGAASAAVTRAVNQDVINAINAGRGQVLYRGHGGGTSWVSGWDGSGTGSGSSFTSGTHIPQLNNRAYPIVYSIACQNARLRLSDSIAEAWLSSSNGAVAHFGASVNSYTSENHERAKGIFRALYESGYTRLGPALAKAECISYGTTGGGSGWDNNTFAYLLLGDPELTVRKRRVLTISQLVANVTAFGLGSRVMVLGESNAPVAAAFVNALRSTGGGVNGFTGLDGSLVLPNTAPSAIQNLVLEADGYPVEVVSSGPILTAIGFGQSGFQLRLEGNPGKYEIQRSSDLRTWTTVTTVSVSASSVEFFDSTASRRGSRFYRAIGL